MKRESMMKFIETNGITYLEELDAGAGWYWGTDYACGDLYEAEEVFSKGMRFEPNRLIFVHYPEGTVVEPIKAQEMQYFGRPVYMDGTIYMLLVNFEEKMIRIFRYTNGEDALFLVQELPLSEVKDCYNLGLESGPHLMLRRQGWENRFQIVWPEKAEFAIGNRESFAFREGDKLFFSEWKEEPEYSEEVVVREYPTGKVIEKIPGVALTMPNGQRWILG